ncbi:MAG: MBL fold metallo-hydrolase [Candidatus Helarchaeota archaeon]
MTFIIRFQHCACFSIETAGLTLVFDPHDGKSLGLPEPKVRNADIVLCSHSHYDHVAGKDLVAKKDAFILVEEEGNFKCKDVQIHGTKVKHGLWREWGFNIVYSVKFPNGKIFIHLGDMGFVPNDVELNSILSLGIPDIAFIPIGSKYVLNAQDALKTAELIRPKMTSVMCHYNYGPLLQKDDFKGMTTEKPFLEIASSNTTIILNDVLTSKMKLKKYVIFQSDYEEISE